MEDPTKLESSGNENKTEIKANTTGDARSGDFVAGTVLASRYRIIGLVGKGGMGEVYKAEDIKLSQTVALKFLPDSYQNDSAALERFHGEVRNARQVSHVNVCRVFDIGEIDGRHFLSMEFVDGDDLSELLTRVGRFTHERAVEISRQLCVGLEAIHKAGILHRDFKPANIIIDKKGVARITDFGIAGIEADISKDEIRSGTPAYMSPEQITGKEVTARSDIYALGLVIYEIFTGKQAFMAATVPELIKMHQTATPTSPSTHVKGIDPLVESVIAQCLEKDPKNRPQSALQVAMALPGGNPMQIALDAGQTPSPEMVAASPKKGSLRPAVAFAMLAVVIFCIGFGTLTAKYTQMYRFVPLDKSGEILQERGRELVEKYGYRQSDSYSSFNGNYEFLNHTEKNDQSPNRWEQLATGQPAGVYFWYRTSPSSLVPTGDWKVSEQDPPQTEPGMAVLRLDTKGRLMYFSGVPPRVDEPAAQKGEFDWAGVFKDAGFDLAAFEPFEPQWTPPDAFDDRRAFSGTYPDNSGVAIRVEAAAYRGTLVSFEIVEPWTKPPGQSPSGPQSAAEMGVIVVLLSLYFGVLFISGWLAVKNIRAGRSDVRGAFRIMLFLFVVRMLFWAFTTHHVAGFEEGQLIIIGLQSALYWSVFPGLMYLAFEPYMRKSVPERVISWNRLLAGDWRDPLVGRDVLIGAVAGSVLILADKLLTYLVPIWIGEPTKPPSIRISALAGVSGFAGDLLGQLSVGLFAAFIVSFLILFSGLLMRRKWLGTAVVLLIFSGVMLVDSITYGGGTPRIVSDLLFAAVVILLPARFGVLAMITFWLFAFDGAVQFGTWYTGGYAAWALTLLALAVFGFYTSTAGQKLWQGKLLGDGD
ncbi:MAG: serine/threonine protein kinase [Acidobacteria bacterium]|nr:serine/threonine protein kinase [Acidobacteriota bacterium]